MGDLLGSPHVASPFNGITKVLSNYLLIKKSVGYFINPDFYYRNVEHHSSTLDTGVQVGLREL